MYHLRIYKTEDIPAKEHKFSEWKTYKEATCEEDGEQKRMCTVCGFEEVKKIPAGHKFEDGYCTICGAEEDKLDDNYYDDDELTTPPARVTVKSLNQRKEQLLLIGAKSAMQEVIKFSFQLTRSLRKTRKLFQSKIKRQVRKL